MLDTGGKSFNFTGISNDITDRKQAEEALKASEQNFRNSLDTSSIGINIIDTDFYTSYVNQAFLDIFGYKNIDEVRINPPYKYYTPETNAAIIPRGEKIARGEPVFNQYEAPFAIYKFLARKYPGMANSSTRFSITILPSASRQKKH